MNVSIEEFLAESSSLASETHLEDRINTLIEFKHDNLPDYGDLARDDQAKVTRFCDNLEKSFSSFNAPSFVYFPNGRFRAVIARFKATLFRQDKVAFASRPTGSTDPLLLIYGQSLGSYQLEGEGAVVDVPRNDCSPPPTVLVQGNILVPETLVGSLDINLIFVEFEQGAAAIAVLDKSAITAASSGMVQVPYQAGIPVGSFVPQFRISNRGLVDGPTATGSISLDHIQVGNSPITMDLAFPQLVPVTGNARDSDGNNLTGFRGVAFTSDRAEILSDPNANFRVLLPLGQEFSVEIIRRFIPDRVPAGDGRFLVGQVVADSEKDLGEVRFENPPPLLTTQIEFKDSNGDPIQGALITAEIIELTGAPTDFSRRSISGRQS